MIINARGESLKSDTTKMDEETSYFADALGNTPQVKIIDFLLENKIFDFTKAEIAEGANVSRITSDKFWPSLEANNMLIETRKIGNGTLYALNKDSEAVQKFAELDRVLTKLGTEKLLANERIPISVPA